jgi:hypothetical protein
MTFGIAIAFATSRPDSPEAPGYFAAIKPADRNSVGQTEATTALQRVVKHRRLLAKTWKSCQPAAAFTTTTRHSAGRWDTLLA